MLYRRREHAISDAYDTGHKNRRNFSTRLGAGLLGIGLLSSAACGNSTYAYDENHSGTEMSMAPCDLAITTMRGVNTEKAAHRCLDARVGKVAMVVFGSRYDMKDMQTQADAIESILLDGTGGVINVEVVPIKATDRANSVHLERNEHFERDGKPCTDDKTLDNTTARVADENMDLDEYDYVLGVDERRACGPVAGISSPEYKKRYASIFDQSNNDNFAQTGAHEIAHGYDMLHADAVRFLPVNSPSGILFFDEDMDIGLLRKDSNGAIDLTSSLESFEPENYQPYGGLDLMGNANFKGLIARGTAVWRLQWPERKLGTAPDHMKFFQGGEVRIPKPTSDLHDFAVLHLGESLELKVEEPTDDNPGTKKYDALVFDPLFVNSMHDVIHVYLVQEDFETSLSLGYISFYQPELETDNTRIVFIGDKAVKLQIGADRAVTYTDVSGQEQYQPPVDKSVGDSIMAKQTARK